MECDFAVDGRVDEWVGKRARRAAKTERGDDVNEERDAAVAVVLVVVVVVAVTNGATKAGNGESDIVYYCCVGKMWGDRSEYNSAMELNEGKVGKAPCPCDANML